MMCPPVDSNTTLWPASQMWLTESRGFVTGAFCHFSVECFPSFVWNPFVSHRDAMLTLTTSS
eukprot:11651494-Heterocapsa_arctica.AAC.1